MKRILKKLFGSKSAMKSADGAIPIKKTSKDAEAFWQSVYDARTTYYEEHIGSFPEDILKLPSMIGVWPGGGLYVMSADKLGQDLWVYTTFGMTNSDMPANATMTDSEVETDDQGRVVRQTGILKAKEQAESPGGAAGYGYEMLVITRENVDWPLGFMQWTVNAEILNDVGILKRVEDYNGLTVQEIQVAEGDLVNVLISKARQPLPLGVDLPNGRMDLLVATVITDDEMEWSMENGRDALLDKLIAAGVGQVSERGRKSILQG
ncbi:hypothetical protein B5T_00357 [Alloalcanivorax dieselolei B5]|uniref:Suppressor of fused-like domain-containing protein n=1 Tax=Alcanivorax dieselolei (strain DSM 16502 / CGMCC 1.3690 / MCCC 1A00001 / B-5) TaxID=930169 RepID=K0C5E4_ALCDB|nr:suppressor of fused domain protein [Alloalcanivorax dieselolei]AFT68644.1 hypothetical protein B5T_00357 [Alloalcanivorax dieselolei B5]GGK05665.1 hypothetical protein GCM10007426_38010 [Alloalcanivorax dieselolei]